MADLTHATVQLEVAWARLCQRWADVKGEWNDPVQREFERAFWASLETQVPAAQRELKRLSKVLEQVWKNAR